MPERAFASEAWTNDAWFQKLNRDQRYLFIYLWTNDHCNQAGLYSITTETIAFEAKIEEARLPELLKSLSPKVEWYPDLNLVWVKNFVKRQAKSPKFLAAAAKCLTSIGDNRIVQELLDYNLRKHSLSIPYQYYKDKLSILTRALSASVTDTGPSAEVSLFSTSLFSLDEINLALSQLPPAVDRLAEHEAIKQRLSEIGAKKGYTVKSEYATDKGRVDLCWLDRQGTVAAAFEIDFRTPRDKSLEKLRTLGCANCCVIVRSERHPTKINLEQIPPSESEIEESLSAGDREVISVWRSVKGFDMSPANALALVARLRIEFADLDLLAESKAWAARKLSEPVTPRSRPAGQLWNWMRLARKFAAERGAVRRPGRTPSEQELDEQEKRKGILREGEKP